MSSPEASGSREPLHEMQNTLLGGEDAGGGKKARFNALVTKAKQLAHDGYVSKALKYNRQALQLFDNEKLVRRIKKMEVFLRDYDEVSDGISENEEEVRNQSMVHMGNGFYLYRELHDKLYDYQREGVCWMYGLYKRRKGGILGDDMGLGKTIQVIAFLSGLFDSNKIKCVMIVLPVAVMINWEREFDKWAPGIRLDQYHGGSKSERARVLRRVQHRGGVCLTSYGMLVNHSQELAEKDGRGFVWDYVILDEGHKIKNPGNKCSKGVQAVSAKQRLILSGTPIMNNLKEMWALFDWAHQGTLLGRAKTFAMEYDTPITKARQKDATAGEMRLGQEMADHLQKLITPFFLRRTKADMGNGPDVPTFMRKNDLVCWVYLSDIQQNIYEGFVNTPEVKELLNSSKSPLVALTILKKICDHPRLLNNGQCVQLGLPIDKQLMKNGRLTPELASECSAIHIENIKNEDLVMESGKLVFLIGLVDRLKVEGHRCLIFSQSCKVLDIITKVLGARGHKIIRLDGSIRKLPEREVIIEKFTNDTSITVFLLTTQVGGVGLTITAANRVIIYDPSWNPATDAQAVDRSFRIGQEKDVVVYRLITCGSVEEKIYRRQIFKSSITKQATGESKNPYRYFTSQELFELFILDNPRMSVTQQQLQELHGGQETTDTSLDEHLAFLHSLEMYGVSHHDVMFSKAAVAAPPDDDSAKGGAQYISGRVAKAQQMISSECRENKELTRQLGHYPGSEAASQSTEGAKGVAGGSQGGTKAKRSASSRLSPPTAEQHGLEGIPIVRPSYDDTARNIPSRLPPRRIESDSSGDSNNVVDLTHMTDDELETTMNRLDISDTVNHEDHEDDMSTASLGQLSPGQPSPRQQDDVADVSIGSDHYHSVLQQSASEAEPSGCAAETPSPVTTPLVLLTPERPAIGGKRRQTSIENTPASAPRRRGRKSVCYSEVPRRLTLSPVAVEREELMFSPREQEPVVQAHRLPSIDVTASLDYDAFSEHLHANLNSTEYPGGDAIAAPENPGSQSQDTIAAPEYPGHPRRESLAAPVVIEDSPDVTPIRSTRHDSSAGCSVIADSEDDDNKSVNGGGGSDDSSCDSPVASRATSRLQRRAVVDSDEDDDGMDNGNRLESSEEDDSGEEQDSEDIGSADTETSDEDAEDSAAGDAAEKSLVEDDDDADDSATEDEEHSLVEENDEDGIKDENDEGRIKDEGDGIKGENDGDGIKDENDEDGIKDEGNDNDSIKGENDEDAANDEGDDEQSRHDAEEEEGGSDEEEEELTEEEREEYVRLMMKSKELRAGRDYAAALRYAVRGLKIYSGDAGAQRYAAKLVKKLEAKS